MYPSVQVSEGESWFCSLSASYSSCNSSQCPRFIVVESGAHPNPYPTAHDSFQEKHILLVQRLFSRRRALVSTECHFWFRSRHSNMHSCSPSLLAMYLHLCGSKESLKQARPCNQPRIEEAPVRIHKLPPPQPQQRKMRLSGFSMPSCFTSPLNIQTDFPCSPLTLPINQHMLSMASHCSKRAVLPVNKRFVIPSHRAGHKNMGSTFAEGKAQTDSIRSPGSTSRLPLLMLISVLQATQSMPL